MDRDRSRAKRKGLLAVAAGTGGTVLLVTGAPILGVVGLVGGAVLTVDWFLFRARRGMRF